MEMILQSSEIKDLVTALLEFQKTAEDPQRTSTAKVQTRNGRSYSFLYADLGETLPSIRRDLAAQKVHVCQLPVAGFLVTQLTHESGQWLRSYYDLGIAADATPQERGSALTYARRYSLMAVLALVAEDDDDGNLASGNNAEITPPKAVPPSEKFLAKAEKHIPKFKTLTEIDDMISRQKDNIESLPSAARKRFDAAINSRKQELSDADNNHPRNH